MFQHLLSPPKGILAAKELIHKTYIMMTDSHTSSLATIEIILDPCSPADGMQLTDMNDSLTGALAIGRSGIG